VISFFIPYHLCIIKTISNEEGKIIETQEGGADPSIKDAWDDEE
jgi:hypothetical protein